MTRYHHCPSCKCEPPKPFEGEPLWREMRMVGIVEAVAAYYGIPADLMCSRINTQHISEARQITMYLMREKLRYSYPAIGRYMGRDHSTVHFAYNKVKRRINPDTVERIRQKWEQIHPEIPQFEWQASA